MYVTIRRYSGTKWTDEQAKKVQNEFLPIMRKVTGFKDYYCVDGGDGTLSTVSVFADKSGAEESARTAATWVQANMKAEVPNPPEIVTVGKVVAH